MLNTSQNTESTIVLKGAVVKTVSLLGKPEMRDMCIELGIPLRRYTSSDILKQMNGKKVNTTQDVVELIQMIYPYLCYSTNMQELYVKYQNVIESDFEELYNNYISQAFSYSQDMKFVFRILNKILNMLLYILYEAAYKEYGKIKVENISVKSFAQYILAENQYDVFHKLIGLYESEEVLREGGEIEKNLGDAPSDWTRLNEVIQVDDIKVDSNHALLKLKNTELSKLFAQLVTKNREFRRYVFIEREVRALVKKGGDFKPIFLRHTIGWLIKAMIFHTSGGPIIYTNYDFYWKYADRFEEINAKWLSLARSDDKGFEELAQMQENMEADIDAALEDVKDDTQDMQSETEDPGDIEDRDEDDFDGLEEIAALIKEEEKKEVKIEKTKPKPQQSSLQRVNEDPGF